MQVKKFEARTMKEALEMVKSQLGPDAIILSARDNQRSFGLVGEVSVEITAAVSEETLQKKRFTESRMREQERENFNRSSARAQKNIIDKMVNKYTEQNQPRPSITSRRYADIDDEFEAQDVTQAERREMRRQQIAHELAATPAHHQQQQQTKQVTRVAALAPKQESNTEILSLKSEIASLREIISQFQQMPQTMSQGTHPGADYGIPYDLAFMYEQLTRKGVTQEIAAEILTLAQNSIPTLKLKNRNLVEAWTARHLLETIQVTGENVPGKVHVFTGPAGSGKTTAMVKMASRLVMNDRKKVALLTADTSKVGAADQLRIYAQILNVPFAVIRQNEDWSKMVRYLSNVDVVLVDMPGLSLKNPEEINALRRLLPPVALNPRVHFVASAVSKDQDITEAARRYSVIGFDDAIFTSLDESAQHGSLYNFVRRFNVPLHSFGIGPRVPEDYEFATKERVLDLLFDITHQNQTSLESV